MRKQRLVLALLMVATLAGGALARTPHVRAAGACFQETGFCIQGRFLAYWTANGDLARNGYPLTDERQETLEDGQTHTVQYFERVRLEYHPENAAPYNVLLGQFGRRILRADRGEDSGPTPTLPEQAYFPETGHNLGRRFLDYWRANGDLAQFGYPLTEQFQEQEEDGNTYMVQYFERARFERHPENDPPYDVLLGQFGRRILRENAWLADQSALKQLYVTTGRVQTLLGSPAAPYPTLPRPRAYQPFEHGAMIWWGEAVPPSIIVLCNGTPESGATVQVFPDPWRAGEPIGGGPSSQPGLYEPQRGFGALWRANQAVHDCLGYATSPDETDYSGLDHAFARGETLLAVTPEGRFIYVLFGGTSNTPCYTNPTPSCRYERYPEPGSRR